MLGFAKLGWLLRGGGENCLKVRHLSSAYLDGDLPNSRLLRIRAHLENCGPCRAFVEGLAHTLGLLMNLPRVSAPLPLKQSILQRLRFSQ